MKKQHPGKILHLKQGLETICKSITLRQAGPQRKGTRTGQTLKRIEASSEEAPTPE